MSRDRSEGGVSRITSVGWGAHSEPILRYADELALPDHLRARPTQSSLEPCTPQRRHWRVEGYVVQREERKQWQQ